MLVRPDEAGIAEFQQYVLDDLAEAAGRLVPGVNSVRVTLQERNVFCGGIVNVGGTDRRVDAVLQITSADSYVATDPVISVLSGNCGHVQGWRVDPTTIHDTSIAQPLGKPMPLKQMLWINQRLDGTTPEFYNRNWTSTRDTWTARKPRATRAVPTVKGWNREKAARGTSRTGCSSPSRRPHGSSTGSPTT